MTVSKNCAGISREWAPDINMSVFGIFDNYCKWYLVLVCLRSPWPSLDMPDDIVPSCDIAIGDASTCIMIISTCFGITFLNLLTGHPKINRDHQVRSIGRRSHGAIKKVYTLFGQVAKV